ncbi:hypothetical protein Esti_005988 [Eimeria stiedai]
MRGLFQVLVVVLFCVELLCGAVESASSAELPQSPVGKEETSKREGSRDKEEQHAEEASEKRALTVEEEVAAIARGEIDASDYGLIACTAEYNPVRCISSGRIYQNPCFAMNAGVEEYQLEYLHP